MVALQNEGRSQLLASLRHYEVVHVSSVVLSGHSKHTLSATRTSPANISFKMKAFGANITVDLHRNDMLFHPNYHELDEVWKDGVLLSRTRTDLADIESCHYQGTSYTGEETSFAAVSHCGNQGFSGVIHSNGELLSITPAHLHMTPQALGEHANRIRSTLGEKPESKSIHIIYRTNQDSADSHPTHVCGVTHEEEEEHFKHVHQALGGLLDGKNFERHKGLQAITGDWFVEMLVVNDHERLQLFPSAQDTSVNSAALTNQVDMIYMSTINRGTSKLDKSVRIIMTSQITFSSQDPWAAQQVFSGSEVDHTVLIDLFHDWRSSPGNTPAHDNGMLYSGYDFKGQTVGYAGVGAMCAPLQSGGIIQTVDGGAYVGTYIGGAIIAHELGHNFGMAHDSSGNSCPASGFIMNAILNPNPDQSQLPVFSDCSATYFHSFSQFSCLLNQPTTSGLDPVCGNGFTEAGETCDCGQPNQCTDTCCNATSCQLFPGAQCSNDQPCCANCQLIPRSANQVCRAAQSSCDVPEMCDGALSSCPSDNYKGTGTTCTDSVFGAGLCYSGFCASLNRDCSKIGATGYTSCGQSPGSSPCGNLQCSQPGGLCSTFASVNSAPDAPNAIQVSDGTPCGSAMQCRAGSCVSSELLNDKFHWVAGPWDSCYTCGSIQTRTVTCEAQTTVNTGSTTYQANVTASDFMCSPNTRSASRTCVNLTLQCAPSDGNYLTNKARQIADEYGAIDKAQQLRDMVPRLYGPEEFSPEDEAYWKGIILLGLIPLLIGIVCLIWCIGHYTSGCGCGDAAPDPAGYSKSQKLLPWLILMGLCAVALIFASIAEYYNSELNRGVTDENVGALVLIDEILRDALDLSTSMNLPLVFITQNAARILNDLLVANLTLSGLGDAAEVAANQVIDGATDIMYDIGNMSVVTIPGQGAPPGPDVNLTCAPCTALAAALSGAIDEAGHTPLYSINSQATAAQSALFDYDLTVSRAEAEFEMVLNKSTELRTYLLSKQVTLNDYQNRVLSAEKIRFPFSLLIFALPFVFTVTSFVGFFGMSSCFKHQGVLAWSMLVFMWPLMGAHLALAMTFGDSCVYMDTMEDSIAAGTGTDPVEAAALQACLSDSSIVDALNLTRSFSPPTFGLPSGSFSTPQLSDALAAIQNMTVEDLGFTPAMQIAYDGNLTQTGLTPPATKTQLETASNDVNTTIAAAAKVCLTIMEANATAQWQLGILKANATQVGADIAAVDAPLSSARDSLASIDSSLQPLVDACNDLKNLAHCGQIGLTYRVFKDTWCNVITTAFSFLALSCLILGIFSGAFVYLSIMLTKRFGLKRLGRGGGGGDAQMVAFERGNRQERRARRRRRDSDGEGAAG